MGTSLASLHWITSDRAGDLPFHRVRERTPGRNGVLQELIRSPPPDRWNSRTCSTHHVSDDFSWPMDLQWYLLLPEGRWADSTLGCSYLNIPGLIGLLIRIRT